MEWYFYLIVILIGFAAGFINTLAGGGSSLTIPLLIFLGLPVNMANGTNRIAILLQNIVGTSSFAKEKAIDFKKSVPLVVASILGAIPGALIANDLDELMMQRIVGVILIIILILVIFKPAIWLKPDAEKIRSKNVFISFIVFFFIGAYGGFIQIGIGFFLLAGLSLVEKLDLVKANAMKVLIVMAYTPLALAVFIWNKQVDFKLGLILAVGNMAGAWVGSKVAVSWGPGFIRWILIVALTASSAKLLGVF